MKKLLFIYNPLAGREVLKPYVSDVVDIFVKAGYEVTIYPTQSYKDAHAKVLSYTEKYDLVVCSGGDGTIDEVVTGMMERGENGPVGYIPTGTTNDFASSLNIPRDILAAADNAVHGAVFPCDIGRFNDDTFVYIAGFGLFTDVAYQTDQDMKNILGHLAYVLEGAKRLFNVPSYKMTVSYGDEVISDEFIYGMVTNSRSVGGFKNITGRKIKFDDGLFEVTLIKMPKNPIELQDIITALLIEEVDSKYMYSFKAETISFESEKDIPWTLDGEYGGTHSYVEIQNRRRALGIMVPAKYVPELSVDDKNSVKN